MRTITTTIHTFAELSERAKNTAIEQLRGINVDYSWWDSVYEDAARIGLRIESFDLCRNRHAKGSFDLCADDVARAILSEHGDHCNTYTLGAAFLSSRDELVQRYSDGVNTSVVAEGNEYDFDNELDELEAEFLRDLLEEYSVMLQDEWEYMQSDEAIIYTIEANEYEFTESGKLV